MKNIIKKVKSSDSDNNLMKILETRTDLLEYDLSSTSNKRKDEIINNLYRKYCGKNLDYNAPFFVREKENGEGLKNEKINDTPLLLTEKMINEAIEQKIKNNEKIKIIKLDILQKIKDIYYF